MLGNCGICFGNVYNRSGNAISSDYDDTVTPSGRGNGTGAVVGALRELGGARTGGTDGFKKFKIMGNYWKLSGNAFWEGIKGVWVHCARALVRINLGE